MKLAFSTLGCPAWSWSQILHFAKDQGFDGIEIRGIQEALTAESVQAVLKCEEQFTKDFLKENLLNLICLGTSVKLHDTQSWSQALEEIKQSLQICEEFHIPAIRVFGDKLGTEKPSEVIARVLDRLHLLCALSPDTSIFLETHGDFSTIETLLPIVSQMSEQNFGIIWDVEHSDVVYGENYRPFYEVIAPKIKHVHIKDRIQGKGLCLVGEGDIPLKAIIQQLVGDGYDGYFSIEWEKRWKPELADPAIALSRYADWMRQLQL
jgi:sugar phosphate isomerase/epimerase